MSVEQWWSKVKPSTREWLIENNGDALPQGVVAEISTAGGSVVADASSGQSESYLPDEAVDWIEAAANGETP